MSKYPVGETVRVTNPSHDKFDQVGTVTDDRAGITYPFRVAFRVGQIGELFRASDLTLADPDVHTVLDQMDAEPNRRAQVLRTAESLVNGQRADDYGPPQENFGRVAAMWSAQFATKLKEPLTPDEVAIALVHLKLSRLANTPDHADSWIDACGYLALGAEIAEGL